MFPGYSTDRIDSLYHVVVCDSDRVANVYSYVFAGVRLLTRNTTKPKMGKRGPPKRQVNSVFTIKTLLKCRNLPDCSKTMNAHIQT